MEQVIQDKFQQMLEVRHKNAEEKCQNHLEMFTHIAQLLTNSVSFMVIFRLNLLTEKCGQTHLHGFLNWYKKKIQSELDGNHLEDIVQSIEGENQDKTYYKKVLFTHALIMKEWYELPFSKRYVELVHETSLNTFYAMNLMTINESLMSIMRVPVSGQDLILLQISECVHILESILHKTCESITPEKLEELKSIESQLV